MKEGQAWGFDLIIALAVFFVGLIVFYIYAINYVSEQATEIKTHKEEGDRIADVLLSEGVPEGWDLTTVTSLGLTSKGKLNETKIEYLNQIATTDYTRLRTLLNTNKQINIVFQEALDVNGEEIISIGNEPFEEKNLIRITRLTSYQEKPLTMEIYVWS